MFSFKKQKTTQLDHKLSTDTPLHIAIRTCHSVEQIKQFIKTHDEKDIAEMTKTVNDRGELPIFMIYSLPLSHQEHIELQTLLLPFTLLSSYLPFSSEIDAKSILNQYSHLKNTPTYENLELGILAIQSARNLFKESGTHAEINHRSEQDRLDLYTRMSDMRTRFDAEKLIEVKKHSSLPAKEQNEKIMQHKVNFFSGKIAHCDELSYATLNFIYTKNKNKKAGIWHIASDDHVFVIIGANTSYAVVCDALAGDVFPVIEIPSKLHSYYRIRNETSYFNCFAKFNPEYHYIESYFSINESGSFYDKSMRAYMCPFKTPDITITFENMNKPFVNGLTPLCHSAEKKDISLIKTLLAVNADPDVKSKRGKLPLIEAAATGSSDIIKLLLESKATTELTDNLGETALMRATNSGNYQTVKLLLEKKADPNHARYDGATPLFFVLPDKNPKKIINTLIEYKADPNYLMTGGKSALTDAVYTKDLDLLQHLLDAKADPNIPDKDGVTPLYLAAELGLIGQVKLLLQYKANPLIKYQNQFTPKYIAEFCKHEQIVKIFEEFEKISTIEITKNVLKP